MHAYLLAVNLFALTALLVGLNNFSKGSNSWRLLPLFLVVSCRAGILIVSFFSATGQPGVSATLEVFSAFCYVWALMPHPAQLRPAFLWLGGTGGVFLSMMPLLPGWPVPPQIHTILIAIVGLPLILLSLGQTSWLHLAGPLILALASFLALLQLTGLFWVMMLLAYVMLIAALHGEGMQEYRGRQAESAATARQALRLSRERQRLLDVSRIISAIPGLEQSMSHLARSIATVTGVDQAAIFVLDAAAPDTFYLAAIYSPERPVTLTGRYEQPFSLAQFSVLATAIAGQTQTVLSPQIDTTALSELYALWFEDRLGPAYLQSLSVHGRPVGALLLGNPVSQLEIEPYDLALCRHLGPQMAALVEAFRHSGGFKAEAVAEKEPALVMAGADDANHPAVLPTSLPQPAALDLPVAVEPVSQPWSGAEVAGHQAIFEAVHEGVVVSDESGRVRLVNRAAERILGKSRQELMGQPISTIYGQIDSTESIEHLAAAFSRRNEPLPTFAEHEGRAIQGQLIPWRNKNKEWLGIIATFKDVTPSVKADRARNNFITALSRELRAPLTTIKGYSELILRGSLEDYTPEQLHIQQIMHSGVDRMVAVLDNAIQLGAQNKNKIVPHFEQVNVQEVIDDVLQVIAPLAEIHELTLTKEIKSELPIITADRQHLTRILQNLLENACQFTPPGGYVSVRAWVQHERAGNTLLPELILMVADNGIGIPNTESKRIFEPFYQISGVLESGGMGMGLTVVKELVEMHKGRVWVESVVNEGAIFQVALPLTQE